MSVEERIEGLSDRFGALPAALVVAASYVVFIAVAQFGPDLAGTIAAWGCPLFVLVYAASRSSQQGEVLALALMPNFLARGLQDFGASPRLGWLIAPLALALLVAIDRGVVLRRSLADA